MSDNHWSQEEDGRTSAEEAAKRDTFWTLWPKPVSDGEFVEQLRKNLRTLRKWRWTVVVFIAFIFVVIWEMGRMFQVPGQFAPGAQVFSLEELLLYVTISGFLGLSLGFKIGHWFLMAMEMFWGDRRTDLLFKYYDLAQQTCHNFEPPSDTQFDE